MKKREGIGGRRKKERKKRKGERKRRKRKRKKGETFWILKLLVITFKTGTIALVVQEAALKMASSS